MIARYVLEAAAITLVFTKGTIFKAVREHGPKLWQELAACPLCAGVWVGMFWRVLRARANEIVGFLGNADYASLSFAADVLASGAVTGVVALAGALFLSLLDRYS